MPTSSTESVPTARSRATADRQNHTNSLADNGVSESSSPDLKRWPFWKLVAFAVLLFFDLISSILLYFPLLPWIRHSEGQDDGKDPSNGFYEVSSSLLDLGWLAIVRLSLTCGALVVAAYRGRVLPEFYPLELYHPNGEKKTREELEQEALEEPLGPWLRRYVSREAFGAELVAVATQVFAVVKCLARMNIEIGILSDQEAMHPLFWIAVLLAACVSALESSYLDYFCQLAGEYGKERLRGRRPGLLRTVGSQLSIPLLLDSEHNGDVEAEEDVEDVAPETVAPDDVRGVSDITGDSNYRATWTDLLVTCYPDIHLIAVAFVFLFLAAIAQVFIPKYLGKILDSLTAAFADADDDASRHKSMFDIPGFIPNVKLLVLASILAGVFAGIRGSIFTIVGGRVNVRLRIQLMDSLLSQDMGFFDVTKTGDITSRLSSDTTLVGDQVSLNVNVFLRSLVQALGVLLFMFLVSWQLSILAFISVPLITLLSRWYGEFVRSLTKLMQKKLADGNSVCEAALGSMPTVRVFDAAESELSEFEEYMKKYLHLNTRAAIAYCGYATFVTSLPQLVFAVIGTF